MKERPILFSGAMVRAILEGRKTQTRRVVKPQPERVGADGFLLPLKPECPYGYIADRLYVREAWAHDGPDLATVRAAYEDALPGVGYGPYYRATESAPDSLRWRPSIHMPKWAARIWLEVTGVRVERLKEISLGDCVAEGMRGSQRNDSENARDRFRELWNGLNAKRGFGWDANPWVWVVEFRKLPTEDTNDGDS